MLKNCLLCFTWKHMAYKAKLPKVFNATQKISLLSLDGKFLKRLRFLKYSIAISKNLKII